MTSEIPNEIPDFATIARSAQNLHASGDFVGAQEAWQQAEAIAPDELERGRMIRGDAQSAAKMPDECGDGYQHVYAASRALEALRIHSSLIPHDHLGRRQTAEIMPALREQAQSALVLGCMTLRTVVLGEIDPKPENLYTNKVNAEQALSDLSAGARSLKRIENYHGKPDQYSVNAASRLAIANTLYGDKKTGWRQARRAVALGLQSESPRMITNAAGDMSSANRLKARGRATLRGFGAIAVTVLASTKRTRKYALGIAADNRFGL